MALSGHADPEAVFGVTISFTIVAVSAVVLRLYSRIFLVHSPGKDDAFIVAAAVMTVCLTIAQGFQGAFTHAKLPYKEPNTDDIRSAIRHGSSSGFPLSI